MVQQIGIAIVEQAGNYLVGIRAAGLVLAGCAEFPGGKCAAGETPRDCAVRECREETGLTVTAERLLQQTRFRHAHGEVDLHFWLCRLTNGDDLKVHHHGFHWHAASELADMPFPDANRGVIDLICSHHTSSTMGLAAESPE